MTDSKVEEPAEGRAEEAEEPELRGRYVEGDYGRDGKVDPWRKALTEKK